MSSEPPSYQEAISTGGSNRPPRSTSHLEVPQAKNGIPPDRRKSIEDELRPLPDGWVRLFDDKEHHQFFVDTKTDPPRSIWHHPYDDEQFLSSLTSEERERIQEEELRNRRPLTPASFDDEKSHDTKDSKQSPTSPAESFPQALPPRPGQQPSLDAGRKKGLSEKLKEKVTGQTKEERQREKEKRAEEERQYYEAHQKMRAAMAKAQQTGQPQFLGKDRDGKDVYIEPPAFDSYGYQTYRTVNPYSQGLYANPNARFIRPPNPYSRGPYGGYGYGGYGGYGRYGGYGGGLGVPLAGGLIGGALLGGLLF